MIDNLLIRKATPDDIPVILECIRGIAAFTQASDQVKATEALLMDSLFGEHPAAEVALAFVDQQAAGYAVYFHNFSTFEGTRGLYLEDLYIHSAYRGQGIGTAMLKHLAALARERGCARFEWVVLDWNTQAIEFYQGLGAEVLSDTRVCRMHRSAIDQFCRATS